MASNPSMRAKRGLDFALSQAKQSDDNPQKRDMLPEATHISSSPLTLKNPSPASNLGPQHSTFDNTSVPPPMSVLTQFVLRPATPCKDWPWLDGSDGSQLFRQDPARALFQRLLEESREQRVHITDVIPGEMTTDRGADVLLVDLSQGRVTELLGAKKPPGEMLKWQSGMSAQAKQARKTWMGWTGWFYPLSSQFSITEAQPWKRPCPFQPAPLTTSANQVQATRHAHGLTPDQFQTLCSDVASKVVSQIMQPYAPEASHTFAEVNMCESQEMSPEEVDQDWASNLLNLDNG